jgi:hypothetical protein
VRHAARPSDAIGQTFALKLTPERFVFPADDIEHNWHVEPLEPLEQRNEVKHTLECFHPAHEQKAKWPAMWTAIRKWREIGSIVDGAENAFEPDFIQAFPQGCFDVPPHTGNTINPRCMAHRHIPITPSGIVNLHHMAHGRREKAEGWLNARDIAGNNQVLWVGCEPLQKQPRAIPVQTETYDAQPAGLIGELTGGIVQAKQCHLPILLPCQTFCRIAAHRTNTARGKRGDNGGDAKGGCERIRHGSRDKRFAETWILPTLQSDKIFHMVNDFKVSAIFKKLKNSPARARKINVVSIMTSQYPS